MKKNIFMISAAMLALVSCTNDEVIQINNGQKIEFRTALTTRATELTQSDLTEFYVTALTDKDEPYFADIKFSKAGDENYFTSADNYYWPAGGGLKFFAYSPSQDVLGETSTITINSAKKMLEGYTPADDIASQKDFVTAKAVGNKVEHSSSGVALEFKHQLSQIQVNGYNENEGYEISVKAIRLKNVIKTGNFDFGLENWNLGEVSTDKLTDYTITFDNAVLLTSQSTPLMASSGNAMLIPQSRPAWEVEEETTPEEGTVNGGEDDQNGGEYATTTTPETALGTYIAFLIQVNTATGVRVFPTTEDVDYAWVAKPMAFDWVAGYKYTYNCDFTDGLGVIAPDNFEDPDGPNGPKDPILPGGDEDDPKPGDNVYGGKISVSVNFSSWSSYNGNTVDMKPQVPETEEEEEDIPAGGDTPAGGSTEE